ncbi:peptidoglycan-binding domain-containing protein, partial [Neobacillus drentensis]|uniref:peptidoglycan-binding domain-containing protein n=1 Tax=Neobacillus drentensis TaxID=220684 RepID=UPI003000E9C0
MKKWKSKISSRKKRSNIGRFLGKSIGTFVLALILLLSMSTVSLAVGKGAHGPDVYVIQGMLKSLGSYSGNINGDYDNVTVRGVKYFQKQHGLPKTGSVDSRTLQSIIYSYSNLKTPLPAGGKGGGKGPGAGE